MAAVPAMRTLNLWYVAIQQTAHSSTLKRTHACNLPPPPGELSTHNLSCTRPQPPGDGLGVHMCTVPSSQMITLSDASSSLFPASAASSCTSSSCCASFSHSMNASLAFMCVSIWRQQGVSTTRHDCFRPLRPLRRLHALPFAKVFAVAGASWCSSNHRPLARWFAASSALFCYGWMQHLILAP